MSVLTKLFRNCQNDKILCQLCRKLNRHWPICRMTSWVNAANSLLNLIPIFGQDVGTGKLDPLANKAIRDFRAGPFKELWGILQRLIFGIILKNFRNQHNSLPTRTISCLSRIQSILRFTLRRSVRVGIGYRAVSVEINGGFLWFWIGILLNMTHW